MRGKPIGLRARAISGGLIPACAGKTPIKPAIRSLPRAHPRVCGENLLFVALQGCENGSSPRVRGKHDLTRTALASVGLIPACAGKTERQWLDLRRSGAHPRVCGENRATRKSTRKAPGSSPRVRGKRPDGHNASVNDGLIPACAGKTKGRDAPPLHEWAHPRVCGENVGGDRCHFAFSGSSPRVRGKLPLSQSVGHSLRLIPACAGKTFLLNQRRRQLGAHPRVCGEN